MQNGYIVYFICTQNATSRGQATAQNGPAIDPFPFGENETYETMIDAQDGVRNFLAVASSPANESAPVVKKVTLVDASRATETDVTDQFVPGFSAHGPIRYACVNPRAYDAFELAFRLWDKAGRIGDFPLPPASQPTAV